MSLQFRILWTFFFGVQLFVNAQQTFLYPEDFPPELKKRCQRYAKQVAPQNWLLLQNQLQLEAYSLGYFLFESSIAQHNDSLFEMSLDAGPRFEAIELISNENTQVLKPSAFESMVKDSLAIYLDHGYPFVKLTLEAISANKPQFKLQIDKGPHILFGNIVVKPEGIIQAKVLDASKPLQVRMFEDIENYFVRQGNKTVNWVVNDFLLVITGVYRWQVANFKF
jgi:hypothetical protein